MHFHPIRLRPKRIFFILSAIGLLAFLIFTAIPAWAASHVPSSSTALCVQEPTLAHCQLQDPERQGCATDAVTVAHADILNQGTRVGRVERRFSPACQSC